MITVTVNNEPPDTASARPAAPLPVRDSLPDARNLDDVASILRGIIATGDSVPWAVGKAVWLAHKANGPTIEAPADYRRKRLREMCKALSAETGIGTNTLIERYDMHVAFPESDRDDYPNVPYSVFREVWRGSKDEAADERYKWLVQAQAFGWRAHEIRDAIRLSRGETVKPKPMQRNFDVRIDEGGFGVRVILDPEAARALHDLRYKPGVIFTLTARWPDSAPTGGGKKDASE